MTRFLLLFLLLALPAFAQNPDAVKYSPRQILLVDPHPGIEAVLPMLVATDGKQTIEYVPVHEVKEYLDKGARPITLADILSTLGTSSEKINELQAENAKLWQAVAKDSPAPQAVVVQPPAPPQPSSEDIAEQQRAAAQERRTQAVQTWLMLQNTNRNQTINLNYRNCTRFPALCAGR